VFYLTFLVAALWHAPRAVDTLLERFAPPEPVVAMSAGQWWHDGWTQLPAQRRENDPSQRWPLDLQVAGPLEPLQRRMQANGWGVQPQADWLATLQLLDDDVPRERQPVLPATLDTEAETLLLRRPGDEPGQIKLVRLWRAPVQLEGGGPLWVGTTQVLDSAEPFRLSGPWVPDPRPGVAQHGVRSATNALAM